MLPIKMYNLWVNWGSKSPINARFVTKSTTFAAIQKNNNPYKCMICAENFTYLKSTAMLFTKRKSIAPFSNERLWIQEGNFNVNSVAKDIHKKWINVLFQSMKENVYLVCVSSDKKSNINLQFTQLKYKWRSFQGRWSLLLLGGRTQQAWWNV